MSITHFRAHYIRHTFCQNTEQKGCDPALFCDESTFLHISDILAYHSSDLCGSTSSLVS